MICFAISMFSIRERGTLDKQQMRVSTSIQVSAFVVRIHYSSGFFYHQRVIIFLSVPCVTWFNKATHLTTGLVYSCENLCWGKCKQIHRRKKDYKRLLNKNKMAFFPIQFKGKFIISIDYCFLMIFYFILYVDLTPQRNKTPIPFT